MGKNEALLAVFAFRYVRNTISKMEKLRADFNNFYKARKSL